MLKYFSSHKKIIIGDILAYVAPHRYDSLMTHNENTDTDAYYVNKKNPEALLHKYNIRANCFNSLNNNYEDYQNVHSYGLVSFNTAYFRGYDFGFNIETINDVRAEISAITGKDPSGASYRMGDSSGSEFMKSYFLGARDSEFAYSEPTWGGILGDARTYYNENYGLPSQSTTRDNTIVRPSSTRWADLANTEGFGISDSNSWTTQEFFKTKSTRGFFNNFIHWHNLTSELMLHYFDMISKIKGSDFIYACGYDEAVEYMWHAYNIKSVSISETAQGVYVDITRVNDLGVDTALIYTPATIVVDVSGSALRGKHIGCDAVGIREISTDKYAIDVNYSQSQIHIYEDNAYDYYNFTKPVASNIQYNAGVLTFTTNLPCRKTIYITPTNTELDQISIVYRDTQLLTSHSIDLNNASVRNYFATRSIASIEGSDVYLGLITDRKQTSLTDKITLI